MRRRIWAAVVVGVVLVVGAASIGGVMLLEGPAAPDAGAADSFVTQSFDLVERGRYIATVADCVACHTAPGGRPYAGGLALVTPFGTLASPNITPDRETGIGGYTEGDLRRLLREGIGRGGKHIYPAMPYPAYSKMTDADIGALAAYLGALEPVRNAVEVNRLPFPFNIRVALVGWNLLNFAGAVPARDDPERSPEWNRGAYLVQAPGHCGTCHTPKNLLGADRMDLALAGGNLGGWVAPNITADPRLGIGAWSADELVAYLKSGVGHGTIASGPMAEEVVNSSSRMTEPDLRAIATFLLDGKASRAEPGWVVAADDRRMLAGAAIFKDTCAACHGGTGEGVTGLFPRLAGSGIAQQEDPITVIRLVLVGSRGAATAGRPTGPAMPPLGWRLGDAEVAAVITYVRNSWGNAAPPVPTGAVQAARQAFALARDG